MECTQRIECTQELCQNPQERIFLEQIGFLGICGTKYPIRKGPNKIGRDPGTCEIVLNLNSVSRQHAVINVLNSKEYMIMDLGSANKTKLLDKTLQPYIAQPLRNGDTVQFGQIFGVFRLLEDENDLPMTQALDIPDTPVVNKHASKLINFPHTIIPESPDVSDKDDSFVAPSQPKNCDVFKSPSQNYIKSFSRTIAIQPIGSKQIDNIYWNSSKKSVSIDMSLNESDTDPGPIKLTEVEENIHDMETQIPSNDLDDLYSAETQLCDNLLQSRNLKTNIPKTSRPEKELNDNVENKENNNSIYNADTQFTIAESDVNSKNSTGNVSNSEKISKPRLSLSDEEIIFQEVDVEPLDDDFASQPLLLSETIDGTENVTNFDKSIERNIKKEKFIEECDNKSEASTDCEDFEMLLTQKIPSINQNNATPEKRIIPNKDKISSNKNLDIDDDSTDCEDDLFDNNKVNVNNKLTVKANLDTLKMTESKHANKSKINNLKDHTSANINFEDMLTQVVEVVNDQNEVDISNCHKEQSFEDLPTQVISFTSEEVLKENKTVQEKSPFKVPFQTVKSIKRKDPNSAIKSISKICEDDDENFYAATQDIFQDLCSQREINTENKSSNINTGNAQCVPNEVTGRKGDEFVRNKFEEMDVDELKLTKQKSADSASSSDLECTPNNSQKNITFMITEPPNSQEIVKNITFNSKPIVMESFSDSEDNISEQNTPILYHKRKRIKNTKLDLTKKFELESLPSRTITRKRTPTAKVENNSSEIKNAFKNILAPKVFGEQDENVDKEIIAANISRIKNTKNKVEKKKSNQNESIKSAQTKQEKLKSNKIDKEISVAKKNVESPESLSDSKKSRTEKKPSTNEIKKRKTKKNESNNLDSTKPEQTQETSKTDTTRQRSTRIKRTEDKNKPKKDIIKVSIKPKGKRSYEEEIQDESPEKEVRRSKRQKIKKEIEERNTKKTRSNKKTQNEITSYYEREKSIIYKLSDESRCSSPRSVLSVKEDVTMNKTEATSSPDRRSLRRTALKNTNHKVLFTAFSHPDINILYHLLEKLNAVIVTDVKTCTVVVTVELKRTFKLLCAVGLGRPIVGTTWIQACRDSNMIVDPWLYLLKDELREKRFNFELARTLRGKRNFLKGYNVSSTPKIEPGPNEMKLIVECSGGNWREGGSQWVCVSTIEDRALWPSLKRRGAIIVNPEFILGGVLRQKIDLEKNILI